MREIKDSKDNLCIISTTLKNSLSGYNVFQIEDVRMVYKKIGVSEWTKDNNNFVQIKFVYDKIENTLSDNEKIMILMHAIRTKIDDAWAYIKLLNICPNEENSIKTFADKNKVGGVSDVFREKEEINRICDLQAINTYTFNELLKIKKDIEDKRKKAKFYKGDKEYELVSQRVDRLTKEKIERFKYRDNDNIYELKKKRDGIKEYCEYSNDLNKIYSEINQKISSIKSHMQEKIVSETKSDEDYINAINKIKRLPLDETEKLEIFTTLNSKLVKEKGEHSYISADSMKISTAISYGIFVEIVTIILSIFIIWLFPFGTILACWIAFGYPLSNRKEYQKIKPFIDAGYSFGEGVLAPDSAPDFTSNSTPKMNAEKQNVYDQAVKDKSKVQQLTRCKKCNTEFDGVLCPKCGTKVENNDKLVKEKTSQVALTKPEAVGVKQTNTTVFPKTETVQEAKTKNMMPIEQKADLNRRTVRGRTYNTVEEAEIAKEDNNKVDKLKSKLLSTKSQKKRQKIMANFNCDLTNADAKERYALLQNKVSIKEPVSVLICRIIGITCLLLVFLGLVLSDMNDLIIMAISFTDALLIWVWIIWKIVLIALRSSPDHYLNIRRI